MNSTEVKLYSDPMIQKGLLGTGVITEIFSEDDPLTFILKEEPDNKQEVYRLDTAHVVVKSVTPLGERWHLKIGVEKKIPIRVLHSIGENVRSQVKIEPLVDHSQFLTDKFISIDFDGEIIQCF